MQWHEHSVRLLTADTLTKSQIDAHTNIAHRSSFGASALRNYRVAEAATQRKTTIG